MNPRARIFAFLDHLGNQVHHFDLPAHHRELTIVADSLVNLEPTPDRCRRRCRLTRGTSSSG